MTTTSQELLESIREHSAFDYDTQEWITGLPALKLKIRQLTEETNLLFGSNAEKYAFYIRVDLESHRKSAQSRLFKLENELSAYEETVRLENRLNP